MALLLCSKMIPVCRKTYQPLGGRQFSMYMYCYNSDTLLTLKNLISHIVSPIFIKFGQNICFYDNSANLKKCISSLKNMAIRGWSSLIIMKPCLLSIGHIYFQSSYYLVKTFVQMKSPQNF